MKSTTAIICAYNEETTISNVIKGVAKSSLINEIIVINDGSTDYTANVIRNLKVKIEFRDIHFEKNKGKGYAITRGVEMACGEILVFIDADIKNLTPDHLLQLLNPIIDNKFDMVLGQPSETLIDTSINPFKSLTGERALKKTDIVPILNKMKHSRFGVETIINLYYQSCNKRIKTIPLRNLFHPTKFKKTRTNQAIKEFIMEAQQILSTLFINYDLVLKSVRNRFNQSLKLLPIK